MASTAASELLVDLLNDAMLVDTEKEKLEMVHEMQEIILNRDTSLLAEYLPHVLAMHTDKFGAVRRAIVKIAEQTAKRHDAYLPRVMELLLYRVNDEAQSVTRRALSAVGTLLRPALGMLGRARTPLPRTLAEMRDHMGALVARAHALLDSPHEPTRSQAVHVTELATISLTARAGPVGAQTQLPAAARAFDLGRLEPALAGALRARELEELGAAGARALCRQLRAAQPRAADADAAVPALPAAVATAVVNATATVARTCEIHADSAGGALAEAAQRVHAALQPAAEPAAPEASRAAARELLPALTSALQQLGGASDQPGARAELARARADARTRARDALELLRALPGGRGAARARDGGADADASAPKRARAGSRAPSPAPSPPPAVPLSAAIAKSLGGLSAQAVASLVVAGVGRLPKFLAAEAGGALVPAVPAGTTVPHRAGAAEPLSAAECERLRVRAFCRILSDDTAAQVDASEAQALHTRVLSALALLAGVGSEEHAELTQYVCAAPAARRSLALAWLAAEFAPSQVLAGAGGGGGGADALGGADGGGAGAGAPGTAESPERYETVSRQLLRALHADRSWLGLVATLPGDGLDPEVLALIRSDVDVPDRLLPALATLRDVVEHRPAAKAEALALTLELSTSAHDAQRAAAIRLIASRLHPMAELSATIEAFAVSQAEGLLQGHDVGPSGAGAPAEPGADGADGAAAADAEGGAADAAAVGPTEAEARRRLLLLLAVATRKPPLLLVALRIFAHGGAGPRAALQKQIGGVLPHIQPDEARTRILRALIDDHPVGSELLLLKMLHVAAELDGGPPRDLAAEIVARCLRGELDARFALPVLPATSRSEIEPLLPAICALPPNVTKAAILRLVGVGIPVRAQPAAKPAAADGADAAPDAAAAAGAAPTAESAFTPAELFEALHRIRARDDGDDNVSRAPAAAPAPAPTGAEPAAGAPTSAPLGSLVEATHACLKERKIFTADALAAALPRIVAHEPLPRLALRSVLQAYIYHPKLADLAFETLGTAVERAVWRGPHADEQFEGFARLAKKLLPRSLPTLLRVPARRLAPLLDESADLRAQLLKHITDERPGGLDPEVAALLEGAAT